MLRFCVVALTLLTLIASSDADQLSARVKHKFDRFRFAHTLVRDLIQHHGPLLVQRNAHPLATPAVLHSFKNCPVIDHKVIAPPTRE